MFKKILTLIVTTLLISSNSFAYNLKEEFNYALSLYENEEMSLAQDAFLELNKKGETESLLYLGKIENRYFNNRNKSIEYLEKYLSFEKSKNKKEAILEKAYILGAHDRENKKDSKEAIKLFYEYSKLGGDETKAFPKIGEILTREKQSFEKGKKILELFLARSGGLSERILAKIYLEGNFVKRDIKKYKEYLLSSFFQGEEDSIVELILFDIKNNENKKNIYNLISTLENNNPKKKASLKLLGKLYFSGIYVDKNYEKSFDFFIKSIDYKDQEVLYTIALMNYNGLGIDLNIKDSLKMFEALSSGNPYRDSDFYFKNVRNQIKIRAKYANNNFKLFDEYVIGLNRLQMNSLLEKNGFILSKTGKNEEVYLPKDLKNNFIESISIGLLSNFDDSLEIATDYIYSITYKTNKNKNEVLELLSKKYGDLYRKIGQKTVWEKNSFSVIILGEEKVQIKYLFKDLSKEFEKEKEKIKETKKKEELQKLEQLL